MLGDSDSFAALGTSRLGKAAKNAPASPAAGFTVAVIPACKHGVNTHSSQGGSYANLENNQERPLMQDKQHRHTESKAAQNANHQR
jgi:anthranilate phosphoribosyltransferase